MNPGRLFKVLSVMQPLCCMGYTAGDLQISNQISNSKIYDRIAKSNQFTQIFKSLSPNPKSITIFQIKSSNAQISNHFLNH